MQMTGEQRIAAPRDRVWEALNDPAVLAQCIPGCQSLERDGDDRFTAIAEVRIGPIGARFKGAVQLSDVDGPNGYTISGSGTGGIAGSAKGGARVRLSDAGSGETLVSYDVDAEVAGRMAQLGGPIIDATAKNLAGKFFAKFGEVVGEDARGVAKSGMAADVGMAAGVADTPVAASPVRTQAVAAPVPLWGWVAAVVMALVVGYMFGQTGSTTATLLALVLIVVTAACAYEAGRRGCGT
ncbi:carbon monoxide dehydrogenase [Novosphingobium sp. FGD1]|jgi:carbon monoxide dehydrogenase subunit G|uniref:Carbon monoxide dehydrogenase n=1 Tax=Novosphingobium silvae TaxID=2692619 RepID=A0A7X4GFF6_9SPHN|nr:carbon monoxide dehydrogenase subunit G [Novosphingobium silvae]MYL97261.1 carbon monoxide dehydrogenase [Novosphingobium silvae]